MMWKLHWSYKMHKMQMPSDFSRKGTFAFTAYTIIYTIIHIHINKM